MCAPPIILLQVADEPLREALRFALETEGYVVTAQAEEAAVDCVILDTNDRAWPPLTEHPTIVLTGDRERCGWRARDTVCVIEKPLLGDALSRRLSQWLRRPAPP